MAVTRETSSVYFERYPTAEDVLVVAEVSDTTYDFDTRQKANLYARAGYTEYLVLDVNDKKLLVYGSPRGGIYTEIRVLSPGDSYLPNGSSDREIAVEELFPN